MEVQPVGKPFAEVAINGYGSYIGIAMVLN